MNRYFIQVRDCKHIGNEYRVPRFLIEAENLTELKDELIERGWGQYEIEILATEHKI